jgi:predicted dithiol-disulfide oxidoreductase (DUF899 family)
MGAWHDHRFPGESAQYRSARDALLEAEMDLRRQLEAVAAARRALPPGGAVPDGYTFVRVPGGEPVAFAGLFAPGRDTLVVYSYMYGPQAAAPCPLCTSMLDSLDGAAPHLAQRASLAVVARAAPERLAAVARERGWQHLPLYSSGGCTYNRDYLAEDAAGNQWPMLNVFARTPESIRHTWGSEMLYARRADGQHSRHVDLVWPLWNVLDCTPEGRGGDWLPRLRY